MPAFPKLPPVSREPLSVVLLARDDAAGAEAVLAGWAKFLDARGTDYEVVVVDDGSADGTPQLVEALASPRLRVLRHDAPRGEGAALRTGLQAARYPLLFYTLCKPEYRPEDLGKLLERPFVHEEPDRADTPPAQPDKEIDHVHLISGFRAGVKVPGPLRVAGGAWRVVCRVVFSYSPQPLPGWLGLRRHLGWLLARTFFGLRYHDVLCPFRLLRRDLLARLPIQSDGPFAHAELLAKANFLGAVMGEEQPLDVTPGPYRGDFRAIWKEARRVFDHPDFGPPVLPDSSGGRPAEDRPPSEGGDGTTS
jgi:glycosyltransferase involved in cell wall biosynthesis